jgi:hypothetical protein
VEEDAVFRDLKDVAQEKGENAEKGWSKKAPLLHTILDWEGIRG